MEKVLSSIKGAIRQMKIIPLSKVCSRIVDCPHETPEWKETGIPVIRNYNLVDGHIDTSNLSFVDEESIPPEISYVLSILTIIINKKIR